jgi:RHS repeat-associated protein
VITDENGNEVEAFSFDPWGKRRAATLADLEAILGSWSTLNANQQGNLTIPALTLASSTTNKGFTGHEQLDPVGLIHMGGRVYDAEIGRFLSADPFVQDTSNLQALNRYSYVQNNPLSYTDPSGYFLKSLLKKIGKAISNAWQGVWDGAIKPVLQKIGRVFAEVPWLSTAVAAVVCNVNAACWATYGQIMTALNAGITAANGGTIGQIFTDVAIGLIANGIPGNETGSFWQGGLTARLGEAIKSGAGAALIMGGMSAKASGGKFIDGVKGAAIGMGIAYGVSRIAMAAESKAGLDSKNAKFGRTKSMSSPCAAAPVGIWIGCATIICHPSHKV